MAELDKYVIGQSEAKRSVATALRNRMRRQKLPPEQAEDILPKNIIMIGPTGVGKTEIARRLARLTNSPFLKVEASRFTEVGYVGRDVESMIRDLVEISIDMVREERVDEVAEKAEQNAEERLLDLLLPPPPSVRPQEKTRRRTRSAPPRPRNSSAARGRNLRAQLREGKLDERQVDVEVRDRSFPAFEVISSQGMEEMDINIKDILPGLFGSRTKKRRMRVAEAMDYLTQEEENRLIDMDQVTRVAVERAEQSGHHLSGRNRQDRRPGTRARPGREPGRRAARYPAHRRRHHGQHALRNGAHRSYSLHRRRSFPRKQAFRPDP